MPKSRQDHQTYRDLQYDLSLGLIKLRRFIEANIPELAGKVRVKLR
jgi:hypothetical protein